MNTNAWLLNYLTKLHKVLASGLGNTIIQVSYFQTLHAYYAAMCNIMDEVNCTWFLSKYLNSKAFSQFWLLTSTESVQLFQCGTSRKGPFSP